MTTRVAITGAASGIGQATAAALRDRGCRVVGLDIQPGPGIIECDVRDQGSVDAAIDAALAELGGLDVLINCAGVGFPQSAGERPDPKALAVIDINLLGTWRVTAAALGALRHSRGRVINVASGLAFLTMPYATAYTASKRGVVGYSDSLRLEHGDAITVTTVYPGYIRTPIHDAPAAVGLSLEGAVPAEPIEAAVATMVRAALGRPARDLATTRAGALGYAVLRYMPRRLLDRVMRARLVRTARDGGFGPDTAAAALGARLRGEVGRAAGP